MTNLDCEEQIRVLNLGTRATPTNKNKREIIELRTK